MWMTKQEFILSALDLFPDRQIGRGIKAMVENNQLSEHAINVLVVILKRGIDQLTNVVKKYKVDETIARTDKFNQQKQAQQQEDQKDLEHLDAMIDNI
ncbi:MAG: hypothetical protein K6E76_08005 [Patescibacteria group bacterium]|nr:hypothetical protein [Patescibacteria group bacterium]